MVAAVQGLSAIRAWMKEQGAPPPPIPLEGTPSGHESLDRLLSGGFPKGEITTLRGPAGSGRMSVAAALLARLSQAGRPVAWVDGEGTLYPPALAQAGVQLPRLLIVRPPTPAGGVQAAEQIAESGVFDALVVSGLDEALSPARSRRLHLASRRAETSTLLLVSPQTRTESTLDLRLERRADLIMVEATRSRRGLGGRRAALRLGAAG